MALWLAASAAFSTYLANVKSFNVTYGSFAAAIILLVWLWLTNVALLFGAEINAEIERAQEIAEGVPEPDTLDLRQQTDTSAPGPPASPRGSLRTRSDDCRVAIDVGIGAESRPCSSSAVRCWPPPCGDADQPRQHPPACPSEKGSRELTNWTGSRRLATAGAYPLGPRICRARVESARHSRAASAGFIHRAPTGGYP